MVEIQHYGITGDAGSRETFKYNDAGRKIESCDYNSNGDLFYYDINTKKEVLQSVELAIKMNKDNQIGEIVPDYIDTKVLVNCSFFIFTVKNSEKFIVPSLLKSIPSNTSFALRTAS